MSNLSRFIRPSLLLLLAVAGFLPLVPCSGQALADGEGAGGIQTVQLRPNVYVLIGAGENVTLQVGADGAAVIGAGRSDASAALLAAIKRLTDAPIRFVFDTSADAEAVGGNGALAKAGRSIFSMGTEDLSSPGAGPQGRWATIVATSDVAAGMVSADRKAASIQQDNLPTDTFVEPPYVIFFNHEAIRLYPHAARDRTDTLVYLLRSDVIAAGDVINADEFPRIDVQRGGSVQGEIDALNHILRLSDTSLPFAWRDEGTYIVPAYGHIYYQADVARYRDMVVEMRDIIAGMIRRKMTLSQIEAADPALAYQREFGRDTGAWTTNDFVEAVYRSLTGKH